MNNPFDYVPSADCDEAFSRLSQRLAMLRESGDPEAAELCRELDAGKMLGILIAEDCGGERHVLYAFSGQAGKGGFHYPGFVEPVFDYLHPDGYFRSHEREISRLNRDIEAFRVGELEEALNEYSSQEATLRRRLDACAAECRRSKSRRDARRLAGDLTPGEREAMEKQSRHEKAQLRRIRKETEAALAPGAERVAQARATVDRMKEERRVSSEALQRWLFDNFRVSNARGEWRSLSEIFESTSLKVPPSGAGECCGPKLLQAAYRRGWRPVEIAEYWYGAPKGGEVRTHGHSYPACRGKCLPVMGWMMEGLDIVPPMGDGCAGEPCRAPVVIYENEWFCVVDKPGGLLTVPGKGHAPSVEEWLQQRYGQLKDVKVAHRLDRDTSGLVIATFGPEAYRLMQSLFATRSVHKTYYAMLEGDYREKGIAGRGRIDLPLAPDYLDRPRQRVDLDHGKEAVTCYEFLGVADGRSIVKFHPLTGRTHQLRVHSASAQGLGMPIAGDPLYGTRPAGDIKRLYLHAAEIEFTFPPLGERFTFTSPAGDFFPPDVPPINNYAPK